MRRPSIAVLATLVIGAGACATVDDAGVGATASPGAYSSELLEPMRALPSCGDVDPSPVAGELPQGLVLPQGAIAVQVNEAGKLHQVIGFVPLTPVQVLAAYEDLDVELLAREHEQFESELVYETEGHRAFVKSQIACATGSNFVAMVASREDAAAVPTPTGGATPPGPSG